MSEVRNRFFVRGMSRSGGTLMATILDAHPDVSMGYELYEHLLEPNQKNGLSGIQDLITQVECLANPKGWLSGRQKTDVSQQARTIAARIRRGGVNESVFLELLKEFASQSGDICSVQDRLHIVQLLVTQKMKCENKSCWGSKIARRYEETNTLWPNSHFIFMMRDGRDIAASRMNSGNFRKSIKDVAKGYVTQTSRFKEFASKFSSRAHIVKYESLVTTPRDELQILCQSMDLDWSDCLLNHQQENLSIYKDPTGHLSADQLKKPINTNSIGRWKTELSQSDVADFESIAGEVLEEFDYLVT